MHDYYEEDDFRLVNHVECTDDEVRYHEFLEHVNKADFYSARSMMEKYPSVKERAIYGPNAVHFLGLSLFELPDNYTNSHNNRENT